MLAWLAGLLLSRSPFNSGLSWHLQSSANGIQTNVEEAGGHAPGPDRLDGVQQQQSDVAWSTNRCISAVHMSDAYQRPGEHNCL
jgi:hypothetical protein